MLDETTSSSMMNDERPRYMVVAIQSLAIFVALSILLGRIYYLTYYETLRIPDIEAPVNPLGYSIISPEVTIMCFGITILIAVYILFQNWLKSLAAVFKWKRRFALLFWIVYAITLSGVDLLYESADPFIPGFYGFGLTFAFASAMFGHVLMLKAREDYQKQSSSIEDPGDAGDAGDAADDESSRCENKSEPSSTDLAFERVRSWLSSWQSTLFIIPVILGVSGILLMVSLAFSVGRLDAKKTYTTAPHVIVTTASWHESHRDLMSNLNCNQNRLTCFAGLVHFGDEFLFLRPRETVFSNTDPRLYALRIEDVNNIAYLDAPGLRNSKPLFLRLFQ